MKIKQSIAWLLVLNLFGILFLPTSVLAQTADESAVLEIAQGIIDWKTKENGSVDGVLLNDSFLEFAGTTAGDWFPIGLGRLGVEDNYAGYLETVTENVQVRYRESEKLSAAKSTEWHRISLAILASGGDPTNAGAGEDGHPIDLIADGTYDRGKTASLGRQGINGWIWALIVLDTKRYAVPEGSFSTREDILVEILAGQLPDGGFALSGTESDPEVTAMAIQALAPYYNNETKYTYRPVSSDEEVSKTVHQVVEESLSCLSELQIGSEDSPCWENQSAETVAQVVMALCSLGIDPLTDPRFIKNGNTLLDSLLRYRLGNGGFAHSLGDDSADSMAGEQTLCAMAALWRQQNNMRTLYDFRPEQSSALKERVALLEQKFDAIFLGTVRSDLEQLLAEYYSLPEDERSYVSGYWSLSDAARSAGVDIETIAAQTEVVESPQDEQPSSALSRADVDDSPTAPWLRNSILIVVLLAAAVVGIAVVCRAKKCRCQSEEE